MDINNHLDITEIFCQVDDFYQTFKYHYQQQPLLLGTEQPRFYRSRMRLSEVMTMAIAFDGSGFRTFKDFYPLQVLRHWYKALPKLVSYNRFVELMPPALLLLCCFLHTRRREITGISYRSVSSQSVQVSPSI